MKHLYNFFFLYFNFVYGIIFPLSLETRSWQLNLSFLWSYYRVEVHMGRVRAFALLFTRTWSSTLVYFPPKQQLSSIVCFFTATSTAAGAFHKFLILQQKYKSGICWYLTKSVTVIWLGNQAAIDYFQTFSMKVNERPWSWVT